LGTSASFATARDVTLVGNGGTFSTVGGTQLTLTGAIGGAGTLGKTGQGTLVLSGANTYAGGTFVDQGVLDVAADATSARPAACSSSQAGRCASARASTRPQAAP
jgi:autotransporter-associated beta strand protein